MEGEALEPLPPSDRLLGFDLQLCYDKLFRAIAVTS